mmetsp:Transcript_31290/g.66593  ORF Transcript_31290/g.66593 Transcript_31290/m.66593 type:complete len:94 (-) Transcript_31290:33-314(-)
MVVPSRLNSSIPTGQRSAESEALNLVQMSRSALRLTTPDEAGGDEEGSGSGRGGAAAPAQCTGGYVNCCECLRRRWSLTGDYVIAMAINASMQ